MNQTVELTRHLSPAEMVPVCRPLLPTSAALLPYLARIDKARWYSNHGILSIELQQRLSERLGGLHVALASSGTSAIAGAVLATAGRPSAGKGLCILPANTFIGSVAAVEQCGYEPYFVDVDPETWQLLPEQLEGHPVLQKAGLVLPVSPYGRCVPQTPWERFRDVHGIPVVIDGAAMFEAAMRDPEAHIGTVPVALSFHATKSFATGEGGAVVTSAEPVWRSAIQAMNFGFASDRLSKLPSINAKLSEFHAAVGLAELDGWDEKLNGYRRAAEYLGRIGSISHQLLTAPDVASCYALHVASSPDEGRALRQRLSEAGIGCRQWYGAGAHAHPRTSGYGRDDLPVTERLVEVLSGLPIFPDLDEEDASKVEAAISGMD